LQKLSKLKYTWKVFFVGDAQACESGNILHKTTYLLLAFDFLINIVIARNGFLGESRFARLY
jgi:hypothetical protein